MAALRRLPLASLVPLLLVALTAACGGNGVALGQQEQVYLVSAGGGKVSRLTTGRGFSEAPAWSPDGRRIAFISGYRVVVTGRDGRSRRVVLRGETAFDPPSWSPDGRKLAFTALTRPEGPAGIVVAAADGATFTPVAETGWGTADAQRGPVWSPDGRKLAFCLQGPETGLKGGVRASGELNLVVSSADGGRRTTLTSAPGSELDPRWSPDGKWILYVATSPDEPGFSGASLRVVPAAGGPSRTVVPLDESASAAWSPSGRLIAFTGQVGADSTTYLYVVRPDGSGLLRLTGEVVEQTPAWSPDGKSLAYTTYRGTIETIRPDGNGRKTIASLGRADILDLAWSPNGKTIAFDARRTPPEDE